MLRRDSPPPFPTNTMTKDPLVSLNWSQDAIVIFLPFVLDKSPPTPHPHPPRCVHSGSSLCRNLQSHADSCFVYQNIDLFSLYTSSAAPLAWSVFLSFSPSPGAPLTGRRCLVVDLPAKRSLAARGTIERQGSIFLGFLVPNWQCWPLCRWANINLSGPFQNKNLRLFS